ncbi:YihY/virulence factor BrkB family protein [Halococcus saccharolyticus]|uniref:Ribonuclease BN n=1 Tax=Halococcus saccharolyticus DSM 5350 TaxID=1227455 RepID=M0MH03_9EURY|nr:YihY/virulence factor BrkB family protein [Halococcus saccharolyticus]EMA43979.1 ribonuclease BN [Halococcus saccharolyticus DSM 5350]
MNERLAAAAVTVRRIVRHVTGNYVPFLAGSLAYHVFVALVPVSLLSLVVVSAVGGEAGVGYIVELTQPYLTPRARALLANAITGAADRTGLVVLGAGALVWSLFRIFRGIDIAFATIYDAPTHDSLGRQFGDGVVAVLAVTAGLAASVIVGTVVAVVPLGPLARLANPLLFVVVLAVVFFPLYYVFPNVEVTPHDVLPGAVVAAVGWALFHVSFQLYATYAITQEAYEVLGVVLSVLIWVYASMFILLTGAAVNAVLAGYG